MKNHTAALLLPAAIAMGLATGGCTLFHKHHKDLQPQFPKKAAVAPGPMEPDPQPMEASPVEPQPRPMEPQALPVEPQ